MDENTIHPLDVGLVFRQYDEAMTRVYLADAQPAERMALRLLLRDLKLQIVGEGEDWPTVLEAAPAANPDLLLIDWGLVSEGAGNSLAALRSRLQPDVQIILISNFDTREQAALSTGADGFISKTEMIENVASLLLEAARDIHARRILENTESVRIPKNEGIRIDSLD